MPVEDQLTQASLRAQTGAAFARGEQYWREGRVIDFKVLPDWFEGQVLGTRRYHVRVAIVGRTIRGDCNCPVDDGVCKHAVAITLEYLHQRAQQAEAAASAAPSSISSSISSASPATIDPSPQYFALDADVSRYVAAHDISYFLEVSADRLLAELTAAPNAAMVWRHYRYVLVNLGLREIASVERGRHHLARYAPEIATRVKLLLEDEAARVAAAVAEEAARPPAPYLSTEPAVPLLWSKLVAHRASLRSYAAPRPRAFRAKQSFTLSKANGSLQWKEQDLWITPLRGAEKMETILVATGGVVRVLCRCAPAQPARCVHALALLDTALDRLDDPEHRDFGEPMARELLRPAWSRALEELAPPSEDDKPRPQIEVWWQIERELGNLTLTPLVKKVTRTGALTSGARMTPAKLLEAHGEALEPRDQLIAEHLGAWSNASSATYPVRAFAAAVGHPRLLSEEDRERAVALVRVPLGFSALPAGGEIRLEPAIEGARFEPQLLGALLESFKPGEPLFTYDPGAGAGAGAPRFLLIDVSDEARRLWAVLSRHGDTFPPESHAQLLEKLAPFEARLPLSIPRELKGRQISPDEHIIFRLRLLPDVTLELELFIRPGPGAPIYAPNSGPRDVLLLRDGERVYVRRELGTELERARAAFARLPITEEDYEEGPPNCFGFPDPQVALRVVAALDPAPPGVEAEWVGVPVKVGGALTPKQLRVVVDHNRDWFGISGDLKVETGRLELAVLLDAARRQQRYVQTGEHRWMELTEALRDRLRDLSDRTFVGKKRMEISPSAVAAVHALRDLGATIEQAPAWQQMGERMEAATKLKPRPPAALQATLRDYQLEGHAWLARLAAWGAGACLADDMGLGKTVQAIALLLDRGKLGPALVLAPTSVCWNWVDELARFAPSLGPVLYSEVPDRDQCLAKLGKKDVLIVSYGLLVRDADKLAGLTFSSLIIDEAQALKNPTTQRARAARRLNAGFRVALSGTPLENHVGELWSLFSVVFPGLLGSWEQFRDRYAYSIERTRDPEAHLALARVIRPFLLRRTKQEVARELPERTEIQVPVALSAEERGLYEDARLAAVAELTPRGKDVRDEQQRFQVLAALTRLRLLASHPRLYDPTSKVGSSKLRRLLELLLELRAEGHRALVYSQFTSHLALVKEELARAGISILYLDGSTPAAQRRTRIKAFQEGEGDVFLISLAAGGTGINLTAADYVIHLDPWWNPAVEDQATARAHRIGQSRPVTVYRLIARGTIEEKILTMHAEKRALVASVLEGSGAAARLSTGELLDLLSGGPLGSDAIADDGGDEAEATTEDSAGSATAASASSPKKPPRKPKLTLVP
jgi:superfamily II DNA or RNA helicase